MSGAPVVLQMSPQGVALTKAFESCARAVHGRPGHFGAYSCPAGVLTIGWGHTNTPGTAPFDASTVWSQSRCDEVLALDKRKFEARVLRAVHPVKLTQAQFDALVSFDFNTGGIFRSSIPARLKNGRESDVPAVLKRWSRARGKVLPGLVRRREAEAALFEGRIADAMRIAGAVPVDMARRVDRPVPPIREAARAAGAPAGAAGAAAVVVASETTAPATTDFGVMLLAVVVGIAGLALATVQLRRLWRDWA